MTISADLLRGYTDTIIMQQLTDADGYGYGISPVPTGEMRLPVPGGGITVSRNPAEPNWRKKRTHGKKQGV